TFFHHGCQFLGYRRLWRNRIRGYNLHFAQSSRQSRCRIRCYYSHIFHSSPRFGGKEKAFPGTPFLCKEGFPGPFPKNSKLTVLKALVISQDAVTKVSRVLPAFRDPTLGRRR